MKFRMIMIRMKLLFQKSYISSGETLLEVTKRGFDIK